MNPKTLVRLSNIIGTISIILLIYWVFVFTIIEVFGLKVFRENITGTFYLSILGILALMTGALIINIMFNLTRIAEKHNHDENKNGKSTQKGTKWIFALSFPIVLLLLFGGDYLTSTKKEKMLIESAKSIINDNPQIADKLLIYSFDKNWISETSDILEILGKTDKNFPVVKVIVKDSINGSKLYLNFRNYWNNNNDTIKPIKKNFILETSKAERDYLNNVFENKDNELRFYAKDGNYELYYPYIKNENVIVLYFSDYQRYGKIGS